MESDIVDELRERAMIRREAGAEHTATLMDDAADEIERLRAELAAAKKRIAELEEALPRPTLSRCLQLEESLRHGKKEGGGA